MSQELSAEVTLPGSDDTYEVTVTFGPDAKIPSGAKLDVSTYTAESDEYLQAKDAVIAAKKAEDESFNESGMGFAAFDISILDEDGNKVEPSEGAEVKVSVKVKSLPEDVDESALSNTVEMQHLNERTGEISVETVAEAKDITVADGTAETMFTVTSFSTFTLTWDDGESYIHWGIMDNGTFTEWDKTNLDTSAGSVSLNALYDGYTILSATYYTATESISDADAGTDIEWNITKNTDGTWQYTVRSSETTGTIADGSQIYVYYIDNDDIPETEKPTVVPSTQPDPLKTSKTVVANKNAAGENDGTYKITLSVTGDVVEDTHTVTSSANVILVLDVSTSMNENLSSGQSRLTAVKNASYALVNAMPNAAKVDMAVVAFGGSVFNTVNWTTIDSDSVKTTINNAIRNRGTNQGTNWPGALAEAITQANNKKNSGDADPTYVIFLTDGCPTTNADHHNHGSNGTQDIGDTCISDALDNMTTLVNNGCTIYGIYANTTSTATRPYSGSGYWREYTGDTDPLQYIMRVSGAGVANYYQASEADAIRDVFEALAQTITDNLGYSGVSIDDGITALTSVEASVSVSGAAGNFEYSKSGGQYGTGVTWTDAPAASASGSGVTWDLSSIGNLETGVTYTVSFDIWPSQEAYDLVADLNNGLVDFDDLDPDVQAQIGGHDTGNYYLLTNTYLNTNYTFNNESYQYQGDKGDGAMALDAEKISLKKLWPENMLDQYGAAQYRDADGTTKTATEVMLTLTKAGEDYMNVTVKGSEGWKKDDIYISCGLMTVENGIVDIKEPGYDYTITEPSAFSYYWDLISDVYHPMVINGTAHLLVLDESLTTADNVNTFKIDGKYYRVSDAKNVLEGSNYRRSNLNITKTLDGANAPKNQYFEYTVTVEDADSTDGYVWFSAWDPEASTTVKASDWVISGATAQAGDTGYWYAANGSQVVFKIKAGWNVRFLNLKHDSTFSIEETDDGDGFTFDSLAASTQYHLTTEESWHTDTGAKTTGTIIEPNNSYTITYTNKWDTASINVLKVDENDQGLEDAEFLLTRDNEVVAFDDKTDGKFVTTTEAKAFTLGNGVYCLTETKSPDGYIILSNKVYFKVAVSGSTATVSLCDADGNATTYSNATASGDTVTIKNEPGAALPMTGGIGIRKLYTLGGMLLVLSALMNTFICWRRRERRLYE